MLEKKEKTTMAKAISTLNVGDKVKFGSLYGSPIIWKVADKNHSGYPSNTVSLITESIIKIMGFDAKETKNSEISRKNYGNNRYALSNILKWLNSDAAANAWYAPTHTADAPPASGMVAYNPYQASAGFLNAFTADEKNAIKNTTVTTAKNTTIDGGGSETTTSKIFLPSITEVGLSDANGIAEGTKLALFSNNVSRRAKPTAEAVTVTVPPLASFTT
jgi:hypothetical protein